MLENVYVIQINIFIARQHAYACRVRYCYGKSVCLSDCHTLVFYRSEFFQILSTF